jgi:NAD(P)-dependent dehydrogenase (short-subunit alcohol dehydrogenase family)
MRVVITGGSAGIGRAAAIEFARRGAKVAILARGAEGLEGTRRDVEQAGGQALIIPTDVADPDQVEAAAGQVERAWGGIDVWVNNAMATVFSPFEDLSPADFRRVNDVTYLGAVWGTRAALKRMKPRNQGTVVQVGSALAYRSIPLQSAYCAAKSALRAFTDSVRSELIHEQSRIRVTFLVLGAFNTPQFEWARTTIARHPRPVGKIFQPEVAARAIVHAASYPRRETYVGWPAVQAVLGTMFLPGLLDRLLANMAWSGQFTDERVGPERVDNLHAPVHGDHGAHGRYDEGALTTSLQYQAAVGPRVITVFAAAAALALCGLALARRRS